MAVVHVSTFTDFLSAINVSGDIVILDTGIDANAQEITATVNVNCAEIDGAGHNIYNVQSTSNIAVFKFNNMCNVHHVNFLNVLQTQGAGFLQNQSSNYKITVNNCILQGFFSTIGQGNFDFTQCGFVLTNCKNYAFTYYFSGTTRNLVDCYFKCDYISAQGVYRACNAKNCYFDGTLNNPNANALIFDGTGDNSVYNIYVKSTNAVAIYYGSTQTTPCIYNADRVDATVTTNRPFIPLTDAQMHNAAEIAATGFSIIV